MTWVATQITPGRVGIRLDDTLTLPVIAAQALYLAGGQAPAELTSSVPLLVSEKH